MGLSPKRCLSEDPDTLDYHVIEGSLDEFVGRVHPDNVLHTQHIPLSLSGIGKIVTYKSFYIGTNESRIVNNVLDY